MSITIEPLDCGTLTSGQAMFELGSSEEPISLPVPSWLIRHPEGLVLLDCGMHADLVGPSEYTDLVSTFFDVQLSETQLIGHALEAAEVDPAEIDVVILSHLHFDHAGGLSQLPNARLVVQQDEWAAGADDDLAAANAFVSTDYRLGHDVMSVDGEHDLFGDQLVTCLPTPGHTPGHQSVRVRLAERDVVLCADCAYFERTLDGGPLPPVSHDAELQAASIERLRSLRSAGAVLVPGHDAEVLSGLPRVLN